MPKGKGTRKPPTTQKDIEFARKILRTWPQHSSCIAVDLAPSGVLEFFSDFFEKVFPSGKLLVPVPSGDAGVATQFRELQSLNLDLAIELEVKGVVLALAAQSPILGPCVHLGGLNPMTVNFLKYPRGVRQPASVHIHSDATGVSSRVASLILTIRAPTVGGETVFRTPRVAQIGDGVPLGLVCPFSESGGYRVKHYPGLVTTFWSRLRPSRAHLDYDAPVNHTTDHSVDPVVDGEDHHLGLKFVVVVFFKFDGDLLEHMMSIRY